MALRKPGAAVNEQCDPGSLEAGKTTSHPHPAATTATLSSSLRRARESGVLGWRIIGEDENEEGRCRGLCFETKSIFARSRSIRRFWSPRQSPPAHASADVSFISKRWAGEAIKPDRNRMGQRDGRANAAGLIGLLAYFTDLRQAALTEYSRRYS